MKQHDAACFSRKASASLLAILISLMLLAAAAVFPQAAWAVEGDAETSPTGAVTIMHTNDIHGYYTATNRGNIGFAYLASLKAKLKPDLLVDAGDTFHGQAFATIDEGQGIAELMTAVGYDATTPGNHDWNYGAARLLEIAQEGQQGTFSFATLAANVLNAQGNGPYFPDSSISKEVQIELSNGETQTLKVGIFGVIDESFYTSTAARNVEGTTFASSVAYAKSTAKKLRDDGCDIVIALTHNADPKALAENTTDIDAVIAGHEHIPIDDVVKNLEGEEVYVVEAGSHFQYVGLLTLDVQYAPAEAGASDNAEAGSADEGSDSNEPAESGAWTIIGHAEKAYTAADIVEMGLAADQNVSQLISTLESAAYGKLGEQVGTSLQDYPYPETSLEAPGGWELVRTEDTAIGHVVTAAYLAQTGADLAIENAGGIRGGITAGEVTAGDLISISPFGNTVATYQLTGQQILDSLEHSLETSLACRDVLAKQYAAIAAGEDPMQYSWPDNSGSVLVVGGATLTIDWDQPTGQRIRSITIGGQALDLQRIYTVAMNSYLPQQTSEYPAFANMQLLQEWGTCEQALREFVGTAGWEDRVYPLSGTVTYVSDEPSTDPTIDNEPAADDQPKPLQTSTLAQTGDPAAAAAAALALCAFVSATTGIAAVTKRRSVNQR